MNTVVQNVMILSLCFRAFIPKQKTRNALNAEVPKSKRCCLPSAVHPALAAVQYLPRISAVVVVEVLNPAEQLVQVLIYFNNLDFIKL